MQRQGNAMAYSSAMYAFFFDGVFTHVQKVNTTYGYFDVDFEAWMESVPSRLTNAFINYF